MSIDIILISAKLEHAGFSLEKIAKDGGGAWCFGSRAAECCRFDSDWDVFIVLTGVPPVRRVRKDKLDLVFVGSDELKGEWQRMELTSHVARYGISLCAESHLQLSARPAVAAARKHASLARRLRVLDSFWDHLCQAQRNREARDLRRHLQRAQLLSRDVAVPPTKHLDIAWSAMSSAERMREASTCVSGRLREAIAAY